MLGRGGAAVSLGRVRGGVGMPGGVGKSWDTKKRRGKKTLPARKPPLAVFLGKEGARPLVSRIASPGWLSHRGWGAVHPRSGLFLHSCVFLSSQGCHRRWWSPEPSRVGRWQRN